MRNRSLSDFLTFPVAKRPVFSSEGISLDDEPGLYSKSLLVLFISVFLRFNIDFWMTNVCLTSIVNNYPWMDI